MEAVIIVLRPKHNGTVSHDFRPKTYDILLTDVNLTNTDKLKTLKQLPRATISFEHETSDALFQFLYDLTGAELGGLKGKRAVFIPPARSESEKEGFVKGTLYCLPVDSKEKLNPSIVDNLPNTPGFYSLEQVLESVNTNKLPCTRQTKVMLLRLESWLKEKHNVPGAIDLLFSVNTEDRLKRCITNPAYFDDSQMSFSSSGIGTVYSRSIANETLAKMMAIEKCDITIINPLFGSDLNYKIKVDAVAVNKYWGLGRPDYDKITLPQEEETRAPPRISHKESSWVKQYPMHKCAYEGNSKGIKSLIKKGYPVTQRDGDSWAPIHYAAWFGHLEVISILLNEGECSPNITNDNDSTPLHLASSKGRLYVIELLLNHPEIDVNALDKYGKTPLDLCETVDGTDWKAAAQLLRSAMSRPAPKIQVSIMDGTFRMLDLGSGANTTVNQLHQQMMLELDMPESCGHLFTIWICSRNLQLQLKPDHKPIQHLNDWKRKIVGMLTDQDPSREDPQLFWRRDAILSIAEEKKVKQPTAVNLLFHEAYHNYVKSFNPCADQDAIILGGVLMQLNHGDYDPRKAKSIFAADASLRTLVPVAKQRNKNVNWGTKIQAQYKHYSQSMSRRDRSPLVLQQHFLTICWNLTVYGSAFFTGYVQLKVKDAAKSPTSVYIGVNDLGIHIINQQSKAMLQSFSYKDITWEHKTDQAVLEIKLKGSSRGGMSVLTRQAGLINHLMSKLATITVPGT